MKRIAFHSGKISFQKSEFAKSRISFLGWFISNNYLVADDPLITTNDLIIEMPS